ncbi:MAG: hypothetical protein ABJF11_02235 [Reichenbachiella sp.]|uniref:hypothetical protein n=1 Tax=Reichenbachiella sp. TaxID=2184521 RepID=UPI0032659AFA
MAQSKLGTHQERTILLWPWSIPGHKKASLKGVLWSRKYSSFYLMISWTLVALFGFASNRDCDTSWQLSLLCDQAIWLIKLKTEPLTFMQSLITSAWIHNGLEHLLFVTFFGVILIVQSFEAHYGTRRTVLIFFASHTLIGITYALIFNIGLTWWPDSTFIGYGFERNWMGGSVGFFALIGAFSVLHQKGWILFITAAAFELINHFVLGTSIHISMIHLLCLLYGILFSRWNPLPPKNID